MKIKRILALFILITLMICTFASCNNSNDDTNIEDTTTNTNTEDATSTDETQTSIDEVTSSDEATSSDETTGPDEATSKDDDGNKPDPSVPTTPSGKNDTTTQTMNEQKYYKEIASGYKKVTQHTMLSEENQTFFEGIFELKKESQYKIVSSYSELQAFTLLNFEDVEESIFENNYVVAILDYYTGASSDNYSAAGFYNANFKGIENAEITLDKFYRYSEAGTADLIYIYKLYFIVVSKDEVDYTDEICSINVNTNRLEQYDIEAFNIESTTDKTAAYYLRDRQSKENIDILSSVSILWVEYPCIAIHLDKVIETDFIVNNFKYENGEIYITIEIYQKTEMRFLHNKSANLVVVSLLPVYEDLRLPSLDSVPTDCKINIIFKNVE